MDFVQTKGLLLSLLFALPFNHALAADAGVSWSSNSVLFYIGNLNGADDLWKDAFEEGTYRWNDVPTQFRFNSVRSIGGGYCTGYGDNNVQFSATNCGDDWGANTLGITSYWSIGTQLTKADITFNNLKDWNVYDGPTQFYANDFRRVAIHEMGHAVGLAHPVESGLLMSATVNNTYLPALDDINSLLNKYGSITHTLTINNIGDGIVRVEPKVYGTGVVYDNTLYTSDYGFFLDCYDPVCEIPIQDGLRLNITATPDYGANFISWEGTTIIGTGVELVALTDDRTLTANFSFIDTDGDGLANNIDPDDDGDGLSDEYELSIGTDPLLQDSDGDFYIDSADAFPLNPSESSDVDGDDVGDNSDNCPTASNTNQLDSDNDTLGNACDLDDDNDGLSDEYEATIGSNPLLPDTDDDGYLDSFDAFPLDATETIDTDNDGIGNNADSDDDGDGVSDSIDSFPLDASESVDTDSDGIGNNADTDDDNDGIVDLSDKFPINASETLDADSDGIGNNADTDDDNDGILDTNDNCPFNANTSQADTDGDGIGDICDSVDNSPESSGSSGGGLFNFQTLVGMLILSMLRALFRRRIKIHIQ